MRHIHNAPVPAESGGWGPSAAPPLSAREAARQRYPLAGADAQALEHALTITERERDEARLEAARLTAQAAAERLRLESEVQELRQGLIWEAESAERILPEIDAALARGPAIRNLTLLAVCRYLRERGERIGSLLAREKKEANRVA